MTTGLDGIKQTGDRLPGAIDRPVIDNLNAMGPAVLFEQRPQRLLDQMLLVVEDEHDRRPRSSDIDLIMGGSRIHLPVNRLDLGPS